MMAKRDLVAEIAAAIPSRTGPLPWWLRLPAEAQPQLKAIHAAWKGGTFGPRKNTAARAIATKIRDEYGIEIREQGVTTWLNLPTY
jgi:hypothetical protein